MTRRILEQARSIDDAMQGVVQHMTDRVRTASDFINQSLGSVGLQRRELPGPYDRAARGSRQKKPDRAVGPTCIVLQRATTTATAPTTRCRPDESEQGHPTTNGDLRASPRRPLRNHRRSFQHPRRGTARAPRSGRSKPRRPRHGRRQLNRERHQLQPRRGRREPKQPSRASHRSPYPYPSLRRNRANSQQQRQWRHEVGVNVPNPRQRSDTRRNRHPGADALRRLRRSDTHRRTDLYRWSHSRSRNAGVVLQRKPHYGSAV
jgi:hypothetical protein